jgi:alkylation response protein AidB-like acyl-CoA dehydrogenase
MPFVAGAHTADCILLQDEGLNLHLVRRSQVTLHGEPSVDGSRRLFRIDWKPSPTTRVAESVEHVASLMTALDRGFLATSAQLLGITRQLIDMTVAYVKVREQFQKPVGSFQAVKHHLANAQVKLEFARPLVYRAAWSLAQQEPGRSLHVSMAKAQASDAATLAARIALQCHGAIGYAYEHDLHLWMKRAWALASAWGDATWHRTRVARDVIGPA